MSTPGKIPDRGEVSTGVQEGGGGERAAGRGWGAEEPVLSPYHHGLREGHSCPLGVHADAGHQP